MIHRMLFRKYCNVLRDFKKHTSKKILKQIQEEPESRRGLIFNLTRGLQIRYFLVQDYKSCTAGYSGMKSPVNISMIELHSLF